MIYIAAYIVLGISTGVWSWLSTDDGEHKTPVTVIVGLVWPVVWAVMIINAVRGQLISKCAWCGVSVAAGNDKSAWEAHYLNVCQEHPLAKRCKRLENYLDETDAKCTHYRVKCDVLEAQIYGDTKS